MKSGIVSILNLKNGVGCSCLAWNIAYTLELNLYQHDKAMHRTYNKKRKETLADEMESILPIAIETFPIVKNEFNKGVYDLGSDFNYAHIKKIIAKSEIIIVPTELGHETLIKTMATLSYVLELNQEASIFLVINKLLPLATTDREKKYTHIVQEIIEKHSKERKIDFFYMRHSFFLFRNLNFGFFFLDNYLVPSDEYKENAIKPTIKPYELLKHLMWKTLDAMKNKKNKNKQSKENSFHLEGSKISFYIEHQDDFQEFDKEQPFEDVIGGSFLYKNSRAIKDMLLLTTSIKNILGDA
jgi:hypothetical protein